MKERSLVFFTLASQASAGMLIWLAFLSATGSRLLIEDWAVSGLVLAFSGSAMLVSLVHLGSPLKAWHAVRNLRSSWLSREILVASAFCLLAGVLFITDLLATPDPQAVSEFRTGLVWIAAILAAGLLLAESNVYCLRTAPGWGSRLLGIHFFLTGWLLGGAILTVATIISAVRLELTVVNPWFPLVPGMIAGLGLQTLMSLGSFFGQAQPPAASRSGPLISGLRAISLVGAIFALIFWQVGLAVGLILVEELLGRTVFYWNRSRVGV